MYICVFNKCSMKKSVCVFVCVTVCMYVCVQALYPGRSLYLSYALKDFPRCAMVYLYLFCYEDSFLPFIHTVLPREWDEELKPSQQKVRLLDLFLVMAAGIYIVRCVSAARNIVLTSHAAYCVWDGGNDPVSLCDSAACLVCVLSDCRPGLNKENAHRACVHMHTCTLV